MFPLEYICRFYCSILALGGGLGSIVISLVPVSEFYC